MPSKSQAASKEREPFFMALVKFLIIVLSAPLLFNCHTRGRMAATYGVTMPANLNSNSKNYTTPGCIVVEIKPFRAILDVSLGYGEGQNFFDQGDE